MWPAEQLAGLDALAAEEFNQLLHTASMMVPDASQLVCPAEQVKGVVMVIGEAARSRAQEEG
jgi:hypothetical protein